MKNLRIVSQDIKVVLVEFGYQSLDFGRKKILVWWALRGPWAKTPKRPPDAILVVVWDLGPRHEEREVAKLHVKVLVLAYSINPNEAKLRTMVGLDPFLQLHPRNPIARQASACPPKRDGPVVGVSHKAEREQLLVFGRDANPVVWPNPLTSEMMSKIADNRARARLLVG